jgi:hypothetical protein
MSILESPHAFLSVKVANSSETGAAVSTRGNRADGSPCTSDRDGETLALKHSVVRFRVLVFDGPALAAGLIVAMILGCRCDERIHHAAEFGGQREKDEGLWAASRRGKDFRLETVFVLWCV